MTVFTYEMDNKPFPASEEVNLDLVKRALDYLENDKKATFLVVSNPDTNLFVQVAYADEWILEFTTGMEEKKFRKLFKTETKMVPAMYQQFGADKTTVIKYFDDFMNGKELDKTNFDKLNMK